jgi:hypothetical protein
MNSYSNDPRWTEARFPSVCRCGVAIRKGARIFYFPLSKMPYCEKCGAEESAQFNASRFDEESSAR